MSGIAGFVRSAGAGPPAPDAWDGLTAGLRPGSEPRAARIEGGRVALAVLGAPGYDTWLVHRVRPDGEFALAFHGRLSNAAEVAPASGGGGVGDALLDRFLRDGAEATALALLGEFAFALWDGASGRLTVGVDRVRIQSLLVASAPDAFRFASRMRALLSGPEPLRPTVRPESVLDVVGASVIATPRTIFREVEKVPPGHVLTVRDGAAAARAYWDVDYTHPSDAPVDSLRAETRDALEASLRDRIALEAGEPDLIGAFLSGGIDSSTVAGLMTRLRRRPVRTFSIGFAEEGFNELSFARIVAEAFGTKHREYMVTPRDTLEALDHVADGFDEPFANASAVPTYVCARVAREEGIEALYAGDGGDELFAGNERYATSRVFARYDRLPAWFRNGIFTPMVRAAGTLLPVPVFVKAKKYVNRASLPPAERMTSYGFWYLVPPAEILEPHFHATVGPYRPYHMTIEHYDHARAQTALDRHLYLDLKITISDNDVPKVMRMCEQAGVAVRFPFLDERVVRAAERVPAGVKMRGQELRTFFKETYADLLPAETRAKTKHGFGLPISRWLLTDPALHERMRDLVLGPRALARGYFTRAALEMLMRRHAADATPFYGTILWNLMILELWHRRVLDGAAAATPSS
ncbi:MAG TPA: asparagine synthase-related protein [Acidobacteriota bacterium]|nr:asparagine synthase-related protein [Acidobacteriota bacterium]